MNTEQARQTLNDLHDVLSALRYLDTLLDVALNADGGTLSDRSSGLHYLMEAQLLTLDDGIDLLRGFVKEAETAIIDKRGLPEGWITPPVIRSVHDLPPDHPARRDMQRQPAAEPADKLQGVDLGQIAKDTNLAESTVRRVMERLLADPAPDPQAIARNG